MDDELREKIRTLAEERGIDPATLEDAFSAGGMDEALEKGVEAVMGDVALYAQALRELES